ESGGAGLFDDVERLRVAARDARRDGDPDAPRRIVDELSIERAEQVARAFTVLFHLVNLAEERHRVRVLRQRDVEDAPPPRDSLAAAVDAMSAEAIRRALRELEVHPVFTAPTPGARRRPGGTAAGARETVEIHADHVLRALQAAATRIGRTLPVDTASAPPSEQLASALDVDRLAHPRLFDRLARSADRQPHRQKLMLVAERLAATRDRNADLAYDDPVQLLDDLRLV